MEVTDLRSALELLKTIPGQLLETQEEIDPEAELSGVYRHVGAGGTVMRPTKEGPAMIFHKVKGHPDASVAIGLLASRKRVAALLGTEPENLGRAFVPQCGSSDSASCDGKKSTLPGGGT